MIAANEGARQSIEKDDNALCVVRVAARRVARAQIALA